MKAVAARLEARPDDIEALNVVEEEKKALVLLDQDWQVAGLTDHSKICVSLRPR